MMIVLHDRWRALRAFLAVAARRRSVRFAVAGGALALAATLLTPGIVHAVEPGKAARGAARQETADAALTVPMAVDWKYTSAYYGNNPVSPVVAEGTVYFASGNKVYAVDQQTGAAKWQYPQDTKLTTFIQTTPAVANSTLFCGGGDGLYMLDTTTGKPRRPAFPIRNGVSASPVVVNDVIYFASANGRFYALDTKTGDPAEGPWRVGVDAGGDVSTDFVIVNGMIYYVTSGQTLHSLALSSGQQRWSTRLPNTARANMPPVVVNESIYMTAGNSLSCLRANNGAQRWYVPLPTDAATSPAVDSEGTAYIVLADRNIYAVDRSGRGVWRQPAHVDFEVSAQPILAGKLLLVGTAQGGIYAFDTTTGGLKWRYVVPPSSQFAGNIPNYTNVSARPVVVGDTLFVLTDDGALTAFRHNAPDTMRPTISDLDPSPGDSINGRAPIHFSAHLLDEGSGINPATISLKLDDQPIPRRPDGRQNSDKPGFSFNPDDSVIEYYTLERDANRSSTLPDGHHTVTVSVSDWMGNVATKVWTFSVDDTIPRKTRRSPGDTGTGPGTPGRGRKGGGPSGGPSGGKGGGG